MTLVLRFDVRKCYANNIADMTLEERFYFEIVDSFTDRFRGMGLIAERSYSPFFIENDQVVWRDQFRAPFSSEYIITQALSSFGGFVQNLLEGRGITWGFVQPPGYIPPT